MTTTTLEPPMKDLLEPSCRMALAALLHDLGKFAERARIDEASQRDRHGDSRADIDKQLYCPQWDGHYSHVHAAYTAMALDLIEPHLPPLTGTDVSPFGAWKGDDTDDSLINAAARHHRPETLLQWIVATADRVASGFEREAFERYNRASEGTPRGPDHYRTRQLTLFEQIRTGEDAPTTRAALHWRYPLRPLSVEALFPVPGKDCETGRRDQAQGEYRRLWDGFREALTRIPKSHRANWSLWLDHFTSLWAAFTHSIPAATAGDTRPEVSLYDHSRTTAALATALWRHHQADGGPDEDLAAGLADRSAWGRSSFLLVMGDFFGIQPFIFAHGGQTQRHAAKLLRGRSFYVSLLCQCAALRILDDLGLPPTSQVIDAAGKFLIVAPNTGPVRERLRQAQEAFDTWFLRHTWGESGLGLSWTAASCNDFLASPGAGNETPFRALIDRLFQQLEERKATRLGLCGAGAPAPVFADFLDRFDNRLGVCAVDGRSPASEPLEGEEAHICALAADQIRIGKWLGHHDRLLVTTRPLGEGAHGLHLDLFGCHLTFTGAEAASGRFGALAAEGTLRRAWDYALAREAGETLFRGYARRDINAYIPRLGPRDAWDADRYQGLEEDEGWEPEAPKTFAHLARDDLWLDAAGRWQGTEALMVLKGDVDDLGRIFERGLARPSFAKWASLSRQLNAFFTLWLPWICAERYPNTYTVFAGGDDFFLIGPWRSTLRLAREMRREFSRYVAANPEIHFSVGLSMNKPGLPLRHLGETAEEALEAAKAQPGKDALHLFGQTLGWAELDALWDVLEEIDRHHREFDLSTGYLYRLQELAHMAEDLRSPQPRPENAIWHSWFSYRTWRMLERTKGLGDAERRRRMQELAKVLGEPIARFGDRFLIPLFVHLYQQRTP